MADLLNQRTETALTALEAHVGELVEMCDRLRKENTRLRQENAHLMAERSQLLSNRDKVRSQVEAMITRLKTMEVAG